jgi:putative membrane protein
MRNLFFQSLAGILGLYLAAEFVPGIIFSGPRHMLFLAGIILGILNTSIKPLLHFFLFPLKLLTFGLIGLVINIGIVWFVARVIFSNYFQISGFTHLFLTTIFVWTSSFFFLLLARSVQHR